MEKLGFIGLGNMGYPMAKNLEKAGFPLTVYNRSIEKTDDFSKESVVAKNIPELVKSSDIIFTMLTDDQAVREVYAQILKEDISEKLFIDMSTISLETSKYIASAVIVKEAGFLDAPVAGSTKPAADATLIIMVGGSGEELHRATPYLEKLGKQIVHTGENGKGISAKLAINYFLSTIYQGLAETILFSDKLGLDRLDMLEIINESATGNGATKVKTPLLIQQKFNPAFALDLMLKDVKLAVDAGADFPLSKVLQKTYQSAHEAGFGKEDVIGIINYLKKTNEKS
ncbi:2-hydroxy-3-oxopropionate reductase [Chryseobacterium sp. Leaf180]|uniref:NAD(P)-dependent oxidoreductase n=1 Tax=Chryseobacterium sp. Leaf180 TaxID=1736289 RepID=UPI0006FA327F|nr:NAD(P)-dependent oxidoreductase [Chryseobacterium sp. Leaf180]KQR94624.1 2-hydroxy-3-oxopropionate reductase [Chryseobacterium sp. Leaf180]